MTTLGKLRFNLNQPDVRPISLAGSQHGDIYAGWSNGAVMRLPYSTDTFEKYVFGSETLASTYVKPQTPRTEFCFVEPIAIDAWGVKHSQFVGDRELNAVYQVKADVVHLIAGTGQNGQNDGDGLTEATFASIRSVTVLSDLITVLCSNEARNAVRIINRATNRVSTLSAPPTNPPPTYMLNTSQSTNQDALELIGITSTACSRTISMKGKSPIESSPVNSVTIFERADRKIVLQKCETFAAFVLRRDATPAESVCIDKDFVASLLPIYCPFSDRLIAEKNGSIAFFPNFQGRKDPLVPRTFSFEDASLLLGPTGLKPDLEIIQEASNTSFMLF